MDLLSFLRRRRLAELGFTEAQRAAFASLTPVQILSLAGGVTPPVPFTSIVAALQGSTALTGVARQVVVSGRPVGGVWAGQTVAATSTLNSGISPNQTASGTSDLTFTVTPIAAGSGTVTVSVTGMTSVGVGISATAVPTPSPTPTPTPVPTPTPTPTPPGGTGNANFALNFANGYDEPQTGPQAVGRNYLAFGPGQVVEGNAVSWVKGSTRIPVQLDLATDPWPGGWRRGAVATVQAPGTLPGYTGTPDVETVGTTGYTIQDDGVPYTGHTRPICTEAQFRAALATNDIFLKLYGADMGTDEFRVSVLDVLNNGTLYGIADNAPQQWRQTKKGEVTCQWNIRACAKRVSDGAYHRYIMADLYVEAFGPTGPFEVTGEVGSYWFNGPHPAGTVGRVVTGGHPTIAHFCELYSGTTLINAKGGPNDSWAQTVPVTTLDMTRGMLDHTALEVLQRYTVPWQGASAPSVDYINAIPPIMLEGANLPGGIDPARVYWAAVKEFAFGSLGAALQHTRWLEGGTRFGLWNEWQPNTAYAVGDEVLRRKGIIWYRLVQSGTSGTTGPSGSGTSIVDGTCRWENATAPITSQGSGTMKIIPCAFTTFGSGYELCDHYGHPWWIGAGKAPWVMPKVDHEQLTSVSRLVPHFAESMREQIGFEKYPLTSQRTAPGHSTMPYDWNTGGDEPTDERIGPITNSGSAAIMSPLDRIMNSRIRNQAANALEAPFHYLDPRSGGTMVPNSGPDRAGGRYPGLAPSNPALDCSQYGGTKGGFLGGRDVSLLYDRQVYIARYQTIDSTHMPNWALPPLLMSGHPMYLARTARHTATTLAGTIRPCEIVLDGVTVSRPSTCMAIPGVASTFDASQVRGLAWLTRDVGYFEHVCPAAWAENALAKDFSKDALAFSRYYVQFMKDNYPVYAEMGLMQPNNGETPSALWQQNYLLQSMLMHQRRGLRTGWEEVTAYHEKYVLGIADRDSGGHEALADYLTSLPVYDSALGATLWEQARPSLKSSIDALPGFGADWETRLPATGLLQYPEDIPPFTRKPDSDFADVRAGSAGFTKLRSTAALAASLGSPMGRRVYNRISDRLVAAGYSLTPTIGRKNDPFRGGANLVFPRWHHDPEGFVYTAKSATDVPDVAVLKLGATTNTTQELSWVRPRGTVTGYVRRHRVVGATPWTEAVLGNVQASTVTGLTNLANYEYQIAAVNSAAAGDGRGPWSDSVTKVASPPVATFSGVPAGPLFVGASLTDIAVTFAGFPRAYVGLFIGGVQQGPRRRITSGTPLMGLSVNLAGAGNLRVFDSVTSVTPIATSSGFTISEVPLNDGPYTFTTVLSGYGNPGTGGNFAHYVEIRKDGVLVTPSNLPVPGWKVQMGFGTSSTALPPPTMTDNFGGTFTSMVDAAFGNNAWGVQIYRDNYPATVTHYPSLRTSDGNAHVFANLPAVWPTPAPTPTPTPVPTPTPTPVPTPTPTPTAPVEAPYTIDFFPGGWVGNEFYIQASIKLNGTFITPSNLPAPGWTFRLGHTTTPNGLPPATLPDTSNGPQPSTVVATNFDGGTNSWYLSRYKDLVRGDTTYYPVAITSDGSSKVSTVASPPFPG